MSYNNSRQIFNSINEAGTASDENTGGAGGERESIGNTAVEDKVSIALSIGKQNLTH